MGQAFEQLVTAAKRGRGFAEKMLVGVTPQSFARKPRFETTAGPKVIDCNHPAFVFGHLSIYPARFYAMFEIDPTPVAVAPEFVELFKAGAECRDDAEGTIYPSMDSITTTFFSRHDTLFEKLTTLDDSIMQKPTPDERYRQHFPTIGIAFTFMLTSHIMMHMGQISTWRRCFGLPSAM